MNLHVRQTGRGAILERLDALLERTRDLGPLAEPVGRLLWEANRERALRGVDASGNPFAPLSRATLDDRRRRGFPTGPPLLRRGLDAALIRGCVIEATAGDGRLEFRKSWPDVPFMTYHIQGTARMPRRDPLGWGDELARVRDLLSRRLLSGRT